MSTVFLMKPNCPNTVSIYLMAGQLTEREQHFLAPVRQTEHNHWVVEHSSEDDYRFKHLFELDYNCTRYHYRGVYAYFKGDLTQSDINVYIDVLYATHGDETSEDGERGPVIVRVVCQEIEQQFC